MTYFSCTQNSGCNIKDGIFEVGAIFITLSATLMTKRSVDMSGRTMIQGKGALHKRIRNPNVYVGEEVII